MAMDHSKSLIAFRFFQEKKASRQPFTIQDVMATTGWAKSTVATYQCKKWARHIRRQGNLFRVTGFDGFSEKDFIALQTQNTSSP